MWSKQQYEGKIGIVTNTFAEKRGLILYEGEIVVDGCPNIILEWEILEMPKSPLNIIPENLKIKGSPFLKN